MAIIKVQNVPLIAQPKDGVCWWASAQMLWKWSQATGRGTMKEPTSDDGFKNRLHDNGDWFCGKNQYMATQLSMKGFASITMDFDSVNDHLTKHGPTFASVQKNWNGNNYGHAIVICGVADTGVFIHDPMPVNQGSSCWLTWDQIKKALAGVADVAKPQFLNSV